MKLVSYELNFNFFPDKSVVEYVTRWKLINQEEKMKKFTKITLVLMLVFALALTGCTQKESAKDSGKPKVYTTIYPVYEFTKMIAGDKADVELLIPTGQSLHDWEPGQNDMLKLEKADMLVYNGVGLEYWLDDITSALDNKDLVKVDTSKNLDLIELDHDHDHEHEHEDEDHEHENHNHDNHNHEANEHNHEADSHNHDNHNKQAENHEHEHEHHHHHHGKYDPHVWLDPKNAIIQLRNICDAFVAQDPENKDFYEANFEKSKEKLEELDSLYRTELAGLENSTIVVSHEAYGYLCKEYGLEQKGIQGIFEESEPDSKTIAEIIDLVKNENISTIFTEELIDTKVADSISSQTGAKTEYLNPLEGLSQEEVDNNMDYFSIMKSNLEKLVGALK